MAPQVSASWNPPGDRLETGSWPQIRVSSKKLLTRGAAYPGGGRDASRRAWAAARGLRTGPGPSGVRGGLVAGMTEPGGGWTGAWGGGHTGTGCGTCATGPGARGRSGSRWLARWAARTALRQFGRHTPNGDRAVRTRVSERSHALQLRAHAARLRGGRVHRQLEPGRLDAPPAQPRAVGLGGRLGRSRRTARRPSSLYAYFPATTPKLSRWPWTPCRAPSTSSSADPAATAASTRCKSPSSAAPSPPTSPSTHSSGAFKPSVLRVEAAVKRVEWRLDIELTQIISTGRGA